jgi:hypothetical protein
MIRLACLWCFCLTVLVSRAADPEPLPPPSEEMLTKWAGLSGILVGKLTQVDPGPVAPSFPPLYNHRLTVDVDTVVAGKLKKGPQVLSHTIRQANEPTFPVGKKVIVGLRETRGTVAVRVEEFDEKTLAAIRSVLTVPLGWSVTKGKWLSPWAPLGKEFWPAALKGKGGVVCSVTGRPAARVGPGVEFRVEAVAPKVKKQFQNPDGDGEYTITLHNTSSEAVSVPALLSDGKEIHWKECLVILCQGKAYPIPGAKPVSSEAKPVVLQPGEKISTVVHALSLTGPEWPRGGYRIEFKFALGEQHVSHSLYYFSKHHDPIRDAAQARWKK